MGTPTSPIQPDSAKTQQLSNENIAKKLVIDQIKSADSLKAFGDEAAFSPTLMARRFETLETRHKRTPKEEEAEKSGKGQEKIIAVKRIEKAADDLNKKNPEMQSKSLLLLRSRINQSDTKDEILQKVLEMYPDHSLADEALNFLLETTDGTLAEQTRLAKEEFNQKFQREIRAGKNIQAQTQEFSKQGLAPPPQLRALYREVTGNPRDANTLFNELSSHFDYEKLNKVIGFLLHALGGDLKSKGPSIDRGELHRLLSETRKLQAILGVFRFFNSRMGLISSAFQRQGVPMLLTFDLIAKQFMRAIQERYPSADKILQLASLLGISEELIAQVIIYTQMRDAMRQVAPKLFRSAQHRQDLLNAFMDAIEELDEQLEEEEEDEEDEEKEKEKES